MDAVKFIKERNRMCDAYVATCDGCPLIDMPCSVMSGLDEFGQAEQIVQIVEEWSAKHPQKTRLQDFLEKYPNAPLDEDGTPSMCPSSLGYGYIPNTCGRIPCSECWNLPVEDCAG